MKDSKEPAIFFVQRKEVGGSSFAIKASSRRGAAMTRDA